MNSQRAFFGLLSFVLLFSSPGCKRPPAPSVNTNPNAAPTAKSDPYLLALESFRTPEGQVGGEDLGRFREGIQSLGNHFSTADVMKLLRLETDARKFLAERAHLTDREFAEIESSTFRNADSHYLDECFLLRDVARSLEVSGLGTVDQAEIHFHWVMRNVLLHEQVDSWIPPAFTLRRGHGGPIERAMVFLALLRQSHIEGCLVTTPDAESSACLVGVLKSETSQLFLFDPRLGLPVRSKDGKRITTLQEARDDPALLAPSGIAEPQVKKLVTRLVCPLFAISPRMRVLETGLNEHEPVVLYQDPLELVKEIEKASPLPVSIWNPVAEGKELPNSPTRCLWLFLPTKDGGIDDGQRWAAYTRARLPYSMVILNLARINVDQEHMLSKHAWERLLGIAGDLLNKYDLQPREMLLRGQREPMFRRQHRLELFTRSDVTVNGDDVLKWLARVREAYAYFDVDDPKQRSKAQIAINQVWGEDLFLGRLVMVDKDDQFDRDDKNMILKSRTVLTNIFAFAMRDYLDHEIRRSQALANFETAERAESLLRSSAKPGEAAQKSAAEAWLEAKGAAQRYLGSVSLQARIDQTFQQMRKVNPKNPAAIDLRLSLMELVHREMFKYFQIKACHAESLAHTERDGPKAAISAWEAMQREIESLERTSSLKSELADLRGGLNQYPDQVRAKVQQRIDLLANGWSDGGALFWLKEHARRRIAFSR